jgi:hypothetical protein
MMAREIIQGPDFGDPVTGSWVVSLLDGRTGVAISIHGDRAYVDWLNGKKSTIVFAELRVISGAAGSEHDRKPR